MLILDGANGPVLGGAALTAAAIGGRTALAADTSTLRAPIALEKNPTAVAVGGRPGAPALNERTHRVNVADTIDNSVWMRRDRRWGSPGARVIARTG